MEKTLRKCGSSSGPSSGHLDLNCLPFVIPKRFQLKNNRLPEQDYHLDIHRFNYTFTAENAILKEKAEREAAQQAAQAAQQAAQAALEALELEQAAVPGDSSDDSCEVLLDPHPTNPFLAVSGDVLIPTTAAETRPRSQEPEVAVLDQDLIRSFDTQNSNPFDSQELQSLSNFDALRSVLAPNHAHDLSLFDGKTEEALVTPAVEHSNSSTVFSTVASTGHPTPSPTYTQQQPPMYTAHDAPPPSYSAVQQAPGPIYTNQQPPEPVYSTVQKPPAVIKSKKLTSTPSMEISNGFSIHNSYTAIGTPDTFSAASAQPATSHAPLAAPAPAPPVASCSPFPTIPEEVVARAMQRLEHNQEKCFEFLQAVLVVMTEEECTVEMAETIALLDFPDKKKAEAIILIKQFSELGFSTEDIVEGLKKDPVDRDALLDYLTR